MSCLCTYSLLVQPLLNLLCGYTTTSVHAYAIPVLKTSLGVCVHSCLLTPATASEVRLMFLYVTNSDTEKHCFT